MKFHHYFLSSILLCGSLVWGGDNVPQAPAAPVRQSAEIIAAHRRYDMAIKPVRRAYYAQLAKLDRQLVTDLTAAKEKAMRDGDLAAANAAVAEIKAAVKKGAADKDGSDGNQDNPLNFRMAATEAARNGKFQCYFSHWDPRSMVFAPNGQISVGAAGFEQKWSVKNDCIVISGSGGDMVLYLCSDGSFRGMNPKTGEAARLIPIR